VKQCFTLLVKSIKSQRWEVLRNRICKIGSKRGIKTALAKNFGVSQSVVSQWFKGVTVPTAENALRLLEWVTAEEAKQQKSPGRARTRPERQTRKAQHSHEKDNPSPPPR
jgi:transcriptional regulator with XRE-family HTH domain